MTATLIISSLGGILAFLSVIGISIRAIFRIVNATEDNTKAVSSNTEAINKVVERINNHETRLRILEDRIHRGNSESA